MLELRHGSVHGVRRPLRSLLVGSGLCAALLAGCGARTSVDWLEYGPAGDGGSRPNPQDPAPLAGGAGAPAQGGSAAVGGLTGTGGAPPLPTCEAVSVAIEGLRPALTLVVDQSLSMRTRYPDEHSPATRWSLVGDALFDPTNGVVKRFEASVRFGIAFFTSPIGASGQECPLLNEVQAQTRNYAALNKLYRSLRPMGETPTGDALRKVVSELEEIPSQAPRAILLVTDGNPDTCAQPNPDQGQPQAVAAAQRAFDAGIELYVLGISNGIAGQNLQQLANAGKGRAIDLVWGVDADAAQPFQASDNVRGLTAQLAEILNRIPLCEVRLQRDVTVAEANRGQVTLDGQPLGYSPLNGYVLKDSRHLAIVGNACEALKAGGQQLSVRISCD